MLYLLLNNILLCPEIKFYIEFAQNGKMHFHL